MKYVSVLSIMLCFLGLIQFPAPVFGQIPPGQAWNYQLVEGSFLLDDCPICGPPLIPYRLRGSFTLRLLEQNPIMVRYQISDLNFQTSGAPTEYNVTGSGIYTVGGEVVLRQEMVLDVRINGEPLRMTNELTGVNFTFPWIVADVQQDEPTATQAFAFSLVAPPFHEIWFSTTSGLTPASGNGYVTAGDLLSDRGRVVTSNATIVQGFNLIASDDSSIDAVEIGPGGEIFFSFTNPQFSERIGSIQHGDLLSSRGTRLYLNQQLVENFGLFSNAIDYGLDALSILPTGEVLFSITTSNIVTPQGGPILHRGDLLSNQGRVVRTYQQLLRRFHPTEPLDPGLDAVHVWPNGEVWFSTEDGFQDVQLGTVQSGDLLSDQGLVIYRNLDLVAPFAPLEDLSNFGLDALQVVSDFAPSAPAARFSQITAGKPGEKVGLRWTGGGRTFQVEAAPTPGGPYAAIGPIQLEMTFTDPTGLVSGGQRYYRLRQW